MTPRTIVALLLVVGLSAALMAGGGVASHGGDPTDFTVTPENRDPNASSVEYELSAKLTERFGNNAPNVRPELIVFRIPGATIESCEADDFLGGDNFRLEINESQADGYQNRTLEENDTTWDGDAVQFTIPVPDAEEDQPILDQDDKLELVLEDCAVNPESADWYQGLVKVEGETRTGREVGFTDSSHYFGICDGCESDADAEESLGRPPSATPTPTPESTPTSTDRPTPTDTPAGTPFPSTPEPTPTDTPRPESTPTDTPSSNGGNGGNGGDDENGGGPSLPSVDLEGLGVSPLVVVGVVAIISIGIAGLGVRKL